MSEKTSFSHFLQWNNKIVFKGNNNKLTDLIVWHYNPKTKSLKDLLGKLDSIEYLEFKIKLFLA